MKPDIMPKQSNFQAFKLTRNDIYPILQKKTDLV